MTLTILWIVAVIGLLVFNVILEVFSNFTNINGFYLLCICVCVCQYVCESVSGFIKRGLSGLEQLL